MNNLYEMMMQAQGGNAMQNLARQFGLAPEQAQSAVEALLPAFQLGLQKQTESIDNFQQMMRMMGGGNFAAFHDANGDGIPMMRSSRARMCSASSSAARRSRAPWRPRPR